ncbi:5,10-methylene tetrahydromethanopterin reductase [Burkholderiales bacterium 8X]|nr:5,10-methylene tetrahydromethanopterin reductase [Burkholderiales bacterium 8X]
MTDMTEMTEMTEMTDMTETIRFSYHVSQEQFPPGELLQLTRRAEDAGFDAAFSSDHLQPWAPMQGHSAYVWSWLGAALASTRHISFGTITVPGGWRYHPVVLAQAIATLAAMYPGRLPWIALGSGEAVNECLTGAPWPDKEERNRRLRHGAEVVRALLDGEQVDHEGPPHAQAARLWCKPAQPVRLLGAATSPATAEWLGSWADGLLSTMPDVASLRANIEAFRRGGGVGKPVHAKVDLSWAATEAEALQQAYDNWRFNAASGNANTDLRQPEDFEAATRHLKPGDMHSRVMISNDLDVHVAHLQACIDLGVTAIDLHQVGGDQAAFIDTFGREVLPALRRANAA